MTYRVMGRKKFNFMDKDGRPVVGTKLAVLYEDDQWDGVRAEEIWVNSSISMEEPTTFPYLINAEYNNKGKIFRVEVVD